MQKPASTASARWNINQSQQINDDPLIDCLVLLSEHFGNPCSAQALAAGLPYSGQKLSPELLPQAAARAGLTAKLARKGLNELPAMLLPCILLLKDQKACILHQLNINDNKAIISLPETGGQEQLSIEQLESVYVGYAFLIKQQYRGDRDFDVHLNDSDEHWLWQHIKT